MKSFKKFVSLFVALTMIATMFTNVAFAEDVTFSDVAQDNAHYDAIYNLVNRGVINGYEDGTFKPDDTITRAEFAKIIMVSELGDANISSSLVANFSDTQGHWANRYIAAAVNAGIINGYPEGTFKPDNTVTYAEAVKMVVCALGYGPVIDTTLDPWYTDYIKRASSIGATKNAVAVADNGAMRGLVAQLIDNMDDCQRLVQTGTDSTGKPIFNTSSNGNSFSDDEISNGYGVLVGVYENSLIGSASTLTKSQIQIDDQIYLLDDGVDYTALERYIGYNVDYKIRKTTGNRLYVSNIAPNNGTKVVTIDAYDIDSYSNGSLEYFTDKDHEDTKSYKIDDNLYVIYNGYGVPKSYINSSFISDIFDIEAGTVTLYNNDGDSAMDVAIVEKYQTYFVSSVSKNSSEGTVTIKDKLGIQPDITFDEDRVNVQKITSVGGSLSDALITSIAAKQVVSVAQPHSSAPTDACTKVIISTATVSGSVDSMVGNYETVTVKSKDYNVAKCFKEYLGIGDNEKTYGFDIGSTVKFFLDYTGKIVCTDVTETSSSIGYLIGYLLVPVEGMDSNTEVRILTSSNTIREYPLADNVTINGSNMSASSAITKLQESSALINANKSANYKAPNNSDGGASVEQVITYELGTKGSTQVVKKIGTIGTGTDGDITPYEFTHQGGGTKKSFADCNTGEKLLASTKTKFVTNDGKNSTQFILNSSSIVFYVPYGRTDTKKFKKYSGGAGFAAESTYYVEPYNKNGTTAEIVVWYGDDGDDTANITAASPTVIVTGNIRDNSSDVEVRKISYMEWGSTTEKTAIAENTTFNKNIGVGDVIRIALNGDEIDDIAMVYDASEGKLYNTDKEVEDSNYVSQKYGSNTLYYQAHLGEVYAKPDGTSGDISVLYDNSEEFQTYAITASTVYYQLSTTGSTTSVNTDDASLDSIATKDENGEGTTVVVVAYAGTAKGILIIE